MRILLQLLIPLILPLLNSISMPNHDLKIRIQQQNHIILHAFNIQGHRLRVAIIEIVLKQCWLDHDEGVSGVLAEEGAFVERGLVGGRAEGLDEVGTAQVEHELRE